MTKNNQIPNPPMIWFLMELQQSYKHADRTVTTPRLVHGASVDGPGDVGRRVAVGRAARDVNRLSVHGLLRAPETGRLRAD